MRVPSGEKSTSSMIGMTGEITYSPPVQGPRHQTTVGAAAHAKGFTRVQTQRLHGAVMQRIRLDVVFGWRNANDRATVTGCEYRALMILVVRYADGVDRTLPQGDR